MDLRKKVRSPTHKVIEEKEMADLNYYTIVDYLGVGSGVISIREYQ